MPGTGFVPPPDHTTRPTLRGRFGMFASTHWLASAAAHGRPRARAATRSTRPSPAGFVLHVVEPHLNGPGGDLPVLLATGRRPAAAVLCGQGPAPAAATSSTRAELGLTWCPAPGRWPRRSRARSAAGWRCCATTAPGSCGRARLRDRLRRGGPSGAAARAAATVAARSRSCSATHWPTSAALWLPAGSAARRRRGGRHPALRRDPAAAGRGRGRRPATGMPSIEAARRPGSDGFVAEAIDAFVRHATIGTPPAARTPGVLTGDDLAGWRPATSRR